MLYRYVIIDGFKYPVAAKTYIRKWVRSFTSELAANIVRLNFVDRGPGIRTYTFTVLVKQWAPNDVLYQQGITQTFDQQRANIEASYAKIATSISFVDPFGESPNVPGSVSVSGVYFTNLNQVIPDYSTNQTPYVLYEVELTQSTQVVA